jgi:hypothetical protein
MWPTGRKTKDPDHPTAFISYAHSSEDWLLTVLRFTNLLRTEGAIDAEMDLYRQASHRRWSTYGPKLVETADYTLIAVDPTYKRRWKGDEETGVGAGVGREAAAIRAIFDRDQEEFVRRIKVILLPGVDRADIPADLSDCEWFEIKSFDLPGIGSLLRSLRGKPEFPKPPLGAPPPLPPKSLDGSEPEDEPESDEGPEAEGDAGLEERGELLSEAWAELDGLADSSAPKDDVRRDELLGRAADLQGEIEELERARVKVADRRRLARQWTALILLVIALGGVGAAITGWALAAEGEPSTPQFTDTAPGLALTAPSGWLSFDVPAWDEGLGVRSPLSLSEAGAGALSVFAGISDATGSTLVPSRYRRQLGKRTERSTVMLGQLQAYRYRGLQASGGEALTLFVAPTSIGTAVVACLVPRGAGTAATIELCSRIAGTARLRRGRAYPLGPSQAFGKALREGLAKLDEERRKGLARLSKAKRASREAAAATAIANAYGDAASVLGSVSITPQSANAQAGIVKALRGVRDTYGHLARAASHENEDGYGAATASITAAEGRAAKRLGDLRVLGYDVGKS